MTEVRPLSTFPPQPDTGGYVSAGARISADGLYRYKLWREWRGSHDRAHWRWYGELDGAGRELGEPLSVLFVMLNPSTADGEQDDATIRKCVAFARRWRYERVEVGNLFAYRATAPRDLFAAAAGRIDRIIGPLNQECIQDMVADAAIVVCAWGALAHAAGHDFHVEEVRGWLEHYGKKPTFAFGFTKSGQPRHPLYVPLDAPLLKMPD